jgi:hypothetical protein
MPIPTLQGHSILIVEDEPLIVLDMTQSLSCTQAQITSTNTLKHALILVEMPLDAKARHLDGSKLAQPR